MVVVVGAIGDVRAMARVHVGPIDGSIQTHGIRSIAYVLVMTVMMAHSKITQVLENAARPTDVVQAVTLVATLWIRVAHKISSETIKI